MVSHSAGRWRILGDSVCGASHVSHGLPNQDAIQWWQSTGDLPLIIAVADGHGSARSFRSQVGAQIAVETTVERLRSFVDNQTGDSTLIKGMAEERLPREIVRTWKDRIEAQLAQNPFSPGELEKLRNNGAKAWQSVEANPLLAYGATIMGVLAAETFIVYLQLGDGDILSVSGQGDVTRPMLKDTRFLANETTSLCMPEAAGEMQIGFEVSAAGSPALILLSTDGYSNSFRDDENFLRIGSDLFKMIQTEGLSSVQASLNGWLNQASQQGSGDDITLGIVCQVAAFERVNSS
jgi:serine/threonine protein phosphatase PrpC